MIFLQRIQIQKDNLFIFFFDVEGGGGGAVVGEGGYSKRISLNKNPNVNKKMWGGGGGNAGVGRVRWGLEKVFFYMNPNLK